jgi:putative transposase
MRQLRMVTGSLKSGWTAFFVGADQSQAHTWLVYQCPNRGSARGLGVKSPGPTYLFVTLRGEPYLLWRAVDEHGAELDILLQKRRDKATARRFFRRVMRSCPTPRKIVIDQLRSYSAAKAEIPELASVKHVFVKAAARVNNRAENSHQPTRERERRMRGFRDPKRTQEFLSCFGPIRQHFGLKRHLLRASLYRKQLAARFADWREFTQLAQNPSTGF